MTKILVIEDEKPLREILLQLLMSQGFNAIGAQNGKEGVQMAIAEVPSIILCDVQMPEMDGYEVLKTLRENPLMATIPFIFLTSCDGKSNFRMGMELGADDYLTKPCNKNELFKAIATRLKKKSAAIETLDQALYQAEARLNEWINNSEINNISAEKLEQEARLRRAWVKQEFLVYYQPQVDIFTGKIIGAEALIRWKKPEHGMISPAEFIPLAEETGLIIPIGEWVLQTACANAARWNNTKFAPLRISANLSARQLTDIHLVDRIINMLEKSGLEASNLELEITESSLVENASHTSHILQELKALGISIAIDDFGTGYASLNYLKQFPFDTLKIDKCFVRNINNDSENIAITTAVVQMAHNLNLKVVAEGVETEAELSFLAGQKCDIMQGFLFSRPLPTPEFEKLLFMGESGKKLPQGVRLQA